MQTTPSYTSFGASRSRVDRAGQQLRGYWEGHVLWQPEVEEALDMALRYRAEFQVPLTKVVMGIRSFVKSEGAQVVVAQRLKRMPTILDKLSRHPNMKLTTMQDIGGCRAILPFGGFTYFDGIRRRIEKRHWDVVEVYDYVATPKPTGYRGMHIVIKRDNRLIEVQLRTEGQHRWAETVERLTSRTGFNLKDGQGPKELLLYLERAAYGTATQEEGRPLSREFRDEFVRVGQAAQQHLVRR